MSQTFGRLGRLVLALSSALMLSGCVAGAVGALGAGEFAPTHEAAGQESVRLARPISTGRFKVIVQDSAAALKYDVFSISPSGDKFTLMKKDNMALTLVVGMSDTIEVDVVRANDRKINISVQELGNFGQANNKSANKIARDFVQQIRQRT